MGGIVRPYYGFGGAQFGLWCKTGTKPTDPHSGYGVKLGYTHTVPHSPIYSMVQTVTKELEVDNPLLNKMRTEYFYGHPIKPLSVYL